MESQVTNRVTRQIRVRLSAKDLNERRDQAADAQMELDDVSRKLADLTVKYKAAKEELDEVIGAQEGTISRTLREIKEKKATVTTEVDEVRNYESTMVEYWHPNFEHGEMVDSRPMTAEEHQATLITQRAEEMPKNGMEVSECVQ